MAKSNISKAFVLGGKALFTVFNGANDWYTFAVDKTEQGYVVKWFAGNDNTKVSDYETLGTVNEDLELNIVRPCPKCESPLVERTRRIDNVKFLGCSRYPGCNGTKHINPNEQTAIKAFAFAMLVIAGDIPDTMYPAAEVMHAGRCCKCRRVLTTPESIEKGIGPECRGEKNKAPKRKWSAKKNEVIALLH